jgi:hypothetical protein
MIVAVRGELFSLKTGFTFADSAKVLFGACQHGSEIFVILAAESLGSENDLMLGIDQGLGVVTLDDAVRTGHLHRFIIDDIALDFPAIAAAFGLLLLQEAVQAFDLQLEAPLAFLLPLPFDLWLLVRLHMLGHDALYFFLQFVAFVFEFVERAAPLLGDIGGEFHPIQAEVSACEQTQSFAHEQHVAEEDLDLALHRGDELSKGAVIRGIAIRQGNEKDVLLAGAFDLAGTDHPFGVGQQNDLEQDLGMDGGCAGVVVVVACVKHRQIDMFLHQLADGVFQRTWHKLVLQGNWEHDQLIFIAGFEFRHRFLYLIEPSSFVLDSPTFSTVSTVGVTRLGWDEIKPFCRNQPQARNMLKKRVAYPKSGARIVRWLIYVRKDLWEIYLP